jgi:hypothetical protein
MNSLTFHPENKIAELQNLVIFFLLIYRVIYMIFAYTIVHSVSTLDPSLRIERLTPKKIAKFFKGKVEAALAQRQSESLTGTKDRQTSKTDYRISFH